MAKTFRAVDIIAKKRGNPLEPKGQELTREEIEFLINGYVAGTIPEYQISAWLMAVYFNGMTFAETAALTDVMLHSGQIMDHYNTSISGLTGPFVDKHSTGGVGDKISLPLAPIVAACGVQIPMMSGRALGHTGGTLDKLDSIKGFASRPTLAARNNCLATDNVMCKLPVMPRNHPKEPSVFCNRFNERERPAINSFCFSTSKTFPEMRSV